MAAVCAKAGGERLKSERSKTEAGIRPIMGLLSGKDISAMRIWRLKDWLPGVFGLNPSHRMLG
jgi:hypothetical protein